MIPEINDKAIPGADAAAGNYVLPDDGSLQENKGKGTKQREKNKNIQKQEEMGRPIEQDQVVFLPGTPL